MSARTRIAGLLQFFTESAGATLTKKGGGASLTLASNGAVILGVSNTATGENATVGGGETNTADGLEATVAGGTNNQATGQQSAIGGGVANSNLGYLGTIAGGQENSTSNIFSSVGGGYQNEATGSHSTVGGGSGNIAAGLGACVPGGEGNQATQSYATASGGFAVASHAGERAYAAGKFSTAGDAQHGAWHSRGTTTDATPLVLSLDGVPPGSGGATFDIASGEVYYIRAKFTAVAVAASKAVVTEIKWAVTNFGGTIAQLGATNTSFAVATGSTPWTVAPYVSGSTISATVTGAAATTVLWSCEFQYCRVRG